MSAFKVSFRKANYNDLELLKYWDEQPHVLASDPNGDWEWEIELKRNPEWREQLIAEVNKVPIGFVQIIDPAKEDSHYWGKVEDNLRAIDIWIGEVNYLNKGYGTQMMTQAIDKCFAVKDIKGILIDPLKSNVRAHKFYQRFGFTFVEERQFDKDHCFIFQLRRNHYIDKT